MLTFDDVYGQFHAKIHRYLERMVGRDDAEDLTQEVFIRTSRALPQFRGDSTVSTWIFRIATNVAYDRLRSRSSRSRCETSLESGPPVVDRAPSLDKRVVRGEMNECIDKYIEELPTGYRAAVVLSEHEGFTNQEIADALGVSLETVKIRLHRARARLRKELGDGCSLYRDDRNELACEPKPRSVPPAK